MSVLRPRNRLVNFRMSEEEYEILRAACSLKGARSISDFARSAVLCSVGMEQQQEGSVQKRLSSLGHKVSELESRVERLLKLLDGTDSRNPENSSKQLAG